MVTRVRKITSILTAVALIWTLGACNTSSAPTAKKTSSTSSSSKAASSQSSAVSSSAASSAASSAVSSDVVSDDASPDVSAGVSDSISTISKTKPVQTPQTVYTVNGVPRAYVTVPSSMTKFVRQPENSVKVYDVSKLNKKTGKVITVNANKTYQTIDGFGASITDTAAYSLYQLPQSTRDAAMVKLFDPNQGIGLSILRNPIGTSDFAREYYTYDDMPDGQEDMSLSKFSIAHDMDQIIPLTKQAIKLNPQLKMMGTPWTPPCWMKTIYTFTAEQSPTLRRECYQVYANYLVKYMQAYAAQGIPVYAITPQNEMQAAVGWPGMIFNWQDEITFITEYLKPAIDAKGLKTKIWAYDHNWDNVDVAISIMAGSLDSIDGVAFHHYAGDPTAQSEVNDAFPDKGIYNTEDSFSTGTPKVNFMKQMKEITACLRNYSKAFIMWNLAQDETGGPTYKNVNVGCTPLVIANKAKQIIQYNMDYYSLAHFSKFIRPGAYRVDSTDTSTASDGNVLNLVARNTNGTMTAVLTNATDSPVTFKLVIGSKVIEYTLTDQAAVTLTWDANQY